MRYFFLRLRPWLLFQTGLTILSAADSLGTETAAWVEAMFRPETFRGQTLLPEFADAYGVAFRDINNDDRPDLYIVRFRNLNRLFINRGPDKPFGDRTIRSGLGGNLAPRGLDNLELGASVVDYDDNGIKDVLITGWGVTTNLFHQNANLRFVNLTEKAGISHPMSGNAGIWADIDLDGDLDLFISDEHHANHLYVQIAPGRFRDLASEFGVDAPSISQGASFGDIDNDGYPDLYVCNWMAPDLFYRNVAGEAFVPVQLPLKHLHDSLNSNGVSLGDIDNDGDLDLLVTDRDGQSRLYRNDTGRNEDRWQYTDITGSSGLDNPYPAYSGLIADFNNDGWQDILFTNIGPHLLFLNQGQGSFRLIYQQEDDSRATIQHYSTGAAVADFDRDGDLDLFISNKDTNSVLYINPLDQATYIRLQLEGVRSNRDAIGTKVWLYEQDPTGETPTLSGYREVSGGGGYLSISEAPVHFGVLPTRQYRARIRFPSGKEIELSELVAGQTYSVSEMKGFLKALVRTQQFIGMLFRSPSFWINLSLFLILIGMLWGFISIAIRRYQWSNRQTALFLISTLIVLYLLSGLLAEKQKVHTILIVQIAFFAVFMGFLAGFLEKIRQLKEKRYEYRKVLRRFSDQLIFIRNNPDLYERLVSVIFQTMKPQFCALLEITGEQVQPVKIVGNPDKPVEAFTLSGDQRKDLLERQVVKRGTLELSFPILFEVGAHYIISIGRQEKLTALLLLGGLENHPSIPDEDRTLLTIMANQAALAIENNLFIEQTKALTRKVTEAETREKYVRELEEKNATLEQLYQELKETQAQLVQSEKMSSLGQLVAGIAHELNNPISYIYSNIKELQKYLTVLNPGAETGREQAGKEVDLEFIRDDIQHLMAESMEGSQRVKKIVESLRRFSRLKETEFIEADIHEGLDSTLMLLNREFGDRIQVQKEYGDLPLIYCLPGHLNQVFMNLLLNAAQAIDTRGKIRITTRVEREQIVIEIRDNGRGIPKDVKDKIFDPFFTDKPVGKGTGLGLSISYGIVRTHGGTITVESREGKGTTFTIKLPKRFSRAETVKSEE